MHPFVFLLVVEAFHGTWTDDEGTEVRIEQSMMFGPHGGQLPLIYTSETTCEFQIASDQYNGVLGPIWKHGSMNDSAAWARLATRSEHQVEQISKPLFKS